MKLGGMFVSLIVGTLAYLVHTPAASGQQPADNPPANTKTTDPAPPPADAPVLQVPAKDRDDSQPPRRPRGNRKAMEDKRLAAFSRLKEMIFEEIKFAPEKRATISAMFDNYMAGLITNKEPPHLQPRPEDRSTPQQLPLLEKKLAEVEKAGADPETIAQIKNKIYAAKIVLDANILDEPSFFFDYLNAELSDEERSKFDPVMERWRMLRVPEVAPDDEFKQLRRATRDPYLRESEDIARKLDEIILEAIRTVPLGPERLNPEVMKGLAEKTKPKIEGVLSPSLRDQLEKTLRLVKEWSTSDSELAEKERERLKDYKPVPIRYNANEGSDAPAKP